MKCFSFTCKWLFDRLVALIGLICLCWLYPIIAIAIKIKMPGPVFFVQKRIGKGGRVFSCHKFRTMSLAPSASTVSIAGEQRITPLGAKLRATKLDELPELWDVLRGKMSFVGPRPDVPGYADKLQGSDRDILKLRPGITGPASMKYRDEEYMIAKYVANAQSNGDPRSDEQIAEQYNDEIIYPDKVRLNCYYYRHYSFFKDIIMIFATVLGKRIKYAGEII